MKAAVVDNGEVVLTQRNISRVRPLHGGCTTCRRQGFQVAIDESNVAAIREVVWQYCMLQVWKPMPEQRPCNVEAWQQLWYSVCA